MTQRTFPFADVEVQLEALQREFDRVAMGRVACDLLRLVRRLGQAHGSITYYVFEQFVNLATDLRCTTRWLRDIRHHLKARGIVEERQTETGWIIRIDWSALIDQPTELPTTDLSAVWQGAFQATTPELRPEPRPEPAPEVRPEPAPEDASLQPTTYMQGLEDKEEKATRLVQRFLTSRMPWGDCSTEIFQLDEPLVFERLWVEGRSCGKIRSRGHEDHVHFLALCHRLAISEKYQTPMRVLNGLVKRATLKTEDADALVWARQQMPALAKAAVRELTAAR